MKELGVPATGAAGGRARANPNCVRAPKKRSIVRPVVWSTKGAETCEAEDVGSSESCAVESVVRMHARKMVRDSWRKDVIVGRRNGNCKAMAADVALTGRKRVTRCRTEARSLRAMEKYGILDKVKINLGSSTKGLHVSTYPPHTCDMPRVFVD